MHYTAPPRDDELVIVTYDTRPTVDGTERVAVCRRADHQRHFRNGTSQEYAAYPLADLQPACERWPSCPIGFQECAGCPEDGGAE